MCTPPLQASVAVSLHATPGEVDDCSRRIEALETEQAIIGREAAIGINTAERTATVTPLLEAERARLAQLQTRWQAEKALVDQLLALRAKVAPVLKSLMLTHGVIALPAGPTVLRLLPPLVITESEIDFGVHAIAKAIKELKA